MAEAYIGLPAADVVATKLRTQRVTQGADSVDQEVHTLAAPDGTLLDPASLAQDSSLVTAIARLTSILTALQTTLTVAGSVEVANDVGNPLPVSGPLTDAQLRAAAVGVSVSGTPNVAVTSLPEVEVKNDAGNPLAVSGPLTDTQLRLSPVPVSVAEVEVKNDAGNPLAVSGTVTTRPTTGTYTGAAGTGTATVNVPAGAIVRAFAIQAGSVNATAVVPGITGTVTIIGSSTVQTAFEDQPDPGTMVGPCTFTVTNSAAYCVVWVV